MSKESQMSKVERGDYVKTDSKTGAKQVDNVQIAGDLGLGAQISIRNKHRFINLVQIANRDLLVTEADYNQHSE